MPQKWSITIWPYMKSAQPRIPPNSVMKLEWVCRLCKCPSKAPTHIISQPILSANSGLSKIYPRNEKTAWQIVHRQREKTKTNVTCARQKREKKREREREGCDGKRQSWTRTRKMRIQWVRSYTWWWWQGGNQIRKWHLKELSGSFRFKEDDDNQKTIMVECRASGSYQQPTIKGSRPQKLSLIFLRLI